MDSTPTTNNVSKFRIKRRLESLYNETPTILAENRNTIACVQETITTTTTIMNAKEIKTVLNFDEDSTDSGFVDYDNLVCSNNNAFDDMFNSPINFSKSLFTEKREDSASKRMKTLSVHDNFDEYNIKNALENDDTGHMLIGDKSKQYLLPTMNGKHRDLASITPSTLADLINGKYENEVEKFMVIDARYPYEYDGGHIECSKNLYLKEKLFQALFENPTQVTNSNKRLIIVIHCEFSSERGPKLMREIRERDRMINKARYPQLLYPEIYLLEGGYKNFFETHQDLCVPRSYKPMLHDDHKNDLKFFRKKSKSWELETRKRICKSKLEF